MWVLGTKAVLSNYLKVVVNLWGKKSEHDEMSTLRSITVRVWLRLVFIHVLCAHSCFNATLLLSTTHPPTADDDGESIEDVQDDEHCRFESSYHSISDDEKQHAYGDSEEADVTEERDAFDFEWTNDAHGSCDTRDDKGCCP